MEKITYRSFMTFVMLMVSVLMLSIGALSAAPNLKSSLQKKSRPYEQLIQEVSTRHKVPVDLAHAVIHTESNYNAGAKGSSGEVGLMQIKPATARGLGYSGSVKALFEPANNLEYGMKYLAEAYRLSGGDTCKTILKYNAGHGAKRMNPTSAQYCSKVKTYLASVK